MKRRFVGFLIGGQPLYPDVAGSRETADVLLTLLLFPWVDFPTADLHTLVTA